jgi:hypothetical protein
MFIETVTQPADEFREWSERLQLVERPPAALVASFAWDDGDGRIMSLNVWDEPGAIADFFIERIHPLIEQMGPPTHKPDRHGEAVHSYVRPTASDGGDPRPGSQQLRRTAHHR